MFMTNCYTCSAIILHLLIKSGRGPSLYIVNATKQAYTHLQYNRSKQTQNRGIISGMQSYMFVKTGNI